MSRIAEATIACAVSMLVVAASGNAQTAAGSAFTYQGRLEQAGSPQTGSFDFEVRLFDAPVAGAQVGSTQSLPAVAVTAGLFTVSLDFGAAAFAGDARWLEIAVRVAGTGGFTTLSPRQQLQPAPYALYALAGGAVASDHVHAYDTTTHGVAVLNTFQDVTFDTNVVLSGWTHTSGTAAFTAGRAGLYLVQYGAQAEHFIASASTISVRATLNGAEVAGSQSSVDLLGTGQALTLSRSAVVSIAGGDVLNLQFAGTDFSGRLAANGQGATRPSVTLTILRIR